MKNTKLNIIKIVISLLLFITFIILHVEEYITTMYVVGTLLFVILLYSLVKIFIDVKNYDFEFDVLFVIEFIINLVMMIYLLFAIPNIIIQIIATTLVASTYGGLIVLGLVQHFYKN